MSEKTVLVVDDSKSARLAMRKFLEALGYRVDTADSAQNAYACLKRARPQAIFLDHLMPGIDGFGLLRALKEGRDTAQIPVVLLSSNDDDGFVRSARAQGAAAVLPKPPDAEQVRTLLDHLSKASAGGLGRSGSPSKRTQPAQAAVTERTPVAAPKAQTPARESTDRLEVIERRLSTVERRCDERMRADSALQESLRAAVEQAAGALGKRVAEQLAGLRHDLEAAAQTQQQRLDELAESLQRSLAERAQVAAAAALERALAALLQRLRETQSAS